MNGNSDSFRPMDSCAAQRELGLGIARLRQRKGWSQATLAQRLGVNRFSLGKWERGVRPPTLEHLVALLEVLETTFEELMGIRSPAQIPPAQRSEVARYLGGLVRAIKPLLGAPNGKEKRPE
jgi:transcriptional regulator with XRE-family HTH domain